MPHGSGYGSKYAQRDGKGPAYPNEKLFPGETREERDALFERQREARGRYNVTQFEFGQGILGTWRPKEGSTAQRFQFPGGDAGTIREPYEHASRGELDETLWEDWSKNPDGTFEPKVLWGPGSET